MRIGMLTGGGDCPGLNPALRGFVLRALDYGHECIGFLNGWRGMVEGNARPLGLADVEDIIAQGGTILGTSRTNPLRRKEDEERLLANFAKFELDALAAFGGDDTLGVAARLHKEHGLPTVGVPKTMDNDLKDTDVTFGFDSAVSVATDSIDRLRDTARSHDRVIVVEVMGRHAGWVALYAGIAGGADWILLPEVELDLEEMCAHLVALRERGRNYSIVVVSEGIEVPHPTDTHVDDFGHVILRERHVGEYVAQEIEKRTGLETRDAVLGHVVRGGPPTAFDRVLASRLGIKAAELVHTRQFGMMASIQGYQIVAVKLEEAVALGQSGEKWKRVPPELYEEIKVLFKK